MMQTTDVDHDASTASTANRHDSSTAKSPPSSKTKKNLAKTHRTKLFPLKFEYNVSSSNVQIAQIHGQVIKALLARFGNEIVVYDKDGDKEIQMSSFPRTKASWEASFHMMKVTNTRNDKAIIMVGHQIASSIGLSDIKQGIKDTLNSVNGFIKINDWGSDLDSRSAGFLANLHPVHHDRDLIQNDIVKFLNDSMCDESNSSPRPEFKVVPSSANESQSNKRVSSRFLAITCKNSDDALLLRKKLVSAYSTLPSSIDSSLGVFIPANAKYSDQDLFRKLIRRQNQYLAHHRNIPMDGIDETLLSTRTMTGKSVHDEIILGAKLTRIDPCPLRDHTGRYNFTTTEQHYVEAVEWIDIELPGIIASLPESERGEFDGFIERISPRDVSSAHSTTSTASRKSTTSYLSALTNGFDSESEDCSPPKIRRKSRYNPMIEFDFDDAASFPALPAVVPTTRPSNYRSPTPSSKSASSSITMSEIVAARSEMQAKFDNDMKQFKQDITERLESEIAAAVAASVSTALAGINTTMNKLLSDNNTIVYDNMKSERDIITDATAQVVAEKVDFAVNAAVARAIASHMPSPATTAAESPARYHKNAKRPNTNNDAVMENSEGAK
jgi:hypothetical protein